MLAVRRSEQRGHANHGWLDTWHTFSFGGYFDQEHMGFRALRVINEDFIAPGAGFGTHGHKEMEIVTYVLEGGVAHRDSLGSGGVITPGELQHMSAGTGIRHSEFNASQTEQAHMLQIWLLPSKAGIPPGYSQAKFPIAEERNLLHLLASPDGRANSLIWTTDADLYAVRFDAGTKIEHALKQGRHAWVQIARGSATVNGEVVSAGDGVAISDEPELAILGNTEGTEVLVFDLA